MEITTRSRIHITGLFLLVMLAGSLITAVITLITSRSIEDSTLSATTDHIVRSVESWANTNRTAAAILAETASARMAADPGSSLERIDLAVLQSALQSITTGQEQILVVDRTEHPVASTPDAQSLLAVSLEDSEAVCPGGIWRINRPLGAKNDPAGFLLIGFPLQNLTNRLDTACTAFGDDLASVRTTILSSEGSAIAGADLPPGLNVPDTREHGSITTASDDSGDDWLLYQHRGTWNILVRIPDNNAFSLTPWIIGAASASIVFGLLAMAVSLPPLTRRLGSTISELTAAVGAVSEGNFANQVEQVGEDDLAALVSDVNKLAASLEESVTKIEESAEEVASSAQQILSTSEEHEEATNSQSSALQEMASTVEQMDVSASQASENAQEVVARTERAAQQIETLSERAQRISKVSEVIDEVSNQIRILALSASIEAARAKDSEGFSIIADEIRRLADDTSKSTADIDTLVRDVQSETATSVRTMEQTVEAVKAIGLAMSQQSVATGQITEAMADMNAGMSEAVLFTRASVDAGEELNMMAARLQDTIAKLRNPSLLEDDQEAAAEMDEVPEALEAASVPTFEEGDGYEN